MSKDSPDYKKLWENKYYIYSACEDGRILAYDKRTHAERYRKGMVVDGRKDSGLHVYLTNENGEERRYRLSAMIANAFISHYDSRKYTVTYRNGNMCDCAAWNLIIVPKGKMKQGKQVRVDDRVYASTASAARALFVPQATLRKHIKGEINSPSLQGMAISYA